MKMEKEREKEARFSHYYFLTIQSLKLSTTSLNSLWDVVKAKGYEVVFSQ